MAIYDQNPLIYRSLTGLLYNRFTRKPLLNLINKRVSSYLDPGKNGKFSGHSTRIQQERKLFASAIIQSIERSIDKKILSKATANKILKLWTTALLKQGNGTKNKKNGPFLLVISPGHACNLRCKDCYADSISSGKKLRWDILDRIISDAKRLWDIKLVVFSGGEPFAYSSNNKGILDIVEKNPDILFLAFTNGVLIDKETASRISEYGNLTPAFSVEGLKNTTENRRGKGIFSKILDSMELVREKGIPFGISTTVSSDNITEVLDDRFLDFFFNKNGAFYGFYFQYLPIGRNADFSNMPTPSERLVFWERIWEVIERQKLFLIDFWNHGPLVDGCIAAGRDGGYLYIDWDGKVMPCVFAPYSAGNIQELYNEGKGLESIYDSPFFKSIREWQKDYGFKQQDPARKGNLLISCPYRDHHKDFMEWVRKLKPEPEDKNSLTILTGQEYCTNMEKYNRGLTEVFDPVWEQEYKKDK